MVTKLQHTRVWASPQNHEGGAEGRGAGQGDPNAEAAEWPWGWLYVGLHKSKGALAFHRAGCAMGVAMYVHKSKGALAFHRAGCASIISSSGPTFPGCSSGLPAGSLS